MVIKQFLIALDQLANTLIEDGMADETISARCYRLSDQDIVWKDRHWLIDQIFLHLFNETNHCYNAFMAEIDRKHLPFEYQNPRTYQQWLSHA
jgi:hypothetical protein